MGMQRMHVEAVNRYTITCFEEEIKLQMKLLRGHIIDSALPSMFYLVA